MMSLRPTPHCPSPFLIISSQKYEIDFIVIIILFLSVIWIIEMCAYSFFADHVFSFLPPTFFPVENIITIFQFHFFSLLKNNNTTGMIVLYMLPLFSQKQQHYRYDCLVHVTSIFSKTTTLPV